MPLLVGALIVIAACGAHAATFTWDASTTGTGSDGGGTWSNGGASNWAHGGSDSAWSNSDNTDNAVFGVGGAAGAVTVSGGVNAGNITFNPVASGAYTLTSGTVTLTSGTITTNAASATINSVLAGSVGLNTRGAGTLTLAGADTYTGATTVSAGTLQIGNGSTGSLSNSSVLSATSGATLAFDEANGSTQSNTIADAGTVIGAEGSGIVNTLSGAISGTGVFTQSGAGRTTLSSASTNYSGATTVNSGTLALQSTTAFASTTTVNPGGTLLFTNNGSSVQVPAAAGVILNSGTLAYSSAGNFYTVLNGALTNQAGASSTITIQAGGAGASGFYPFGGIAGSGTLTVISNTAGVGLGLQNSNSTFSGMLIVNGIASTAVGAGSGIAVDGCNTGLQNADIDLNGTMELLNTGMGWANPLTGLFSTGALSGTGVVVANYSGSGGAVTVTLGVNGHSGTFGGTVANGSGNTLSLVKTGAGTQIFTGTNIYTGSTTVNNGTLQIGNGSTGSLSNSSAISVSTGTGTLAFDEATSSTQSNTIADAGTVIGAEGSGIVNTLSGAISGTGRFTQSGAGSTILTGANTYTGATTVSSGTLAITNIGAYASGTTTIASGAVFTVNDSSGQTVSHNTVITGSGTLLYNGPGTWVVGAPTTHTYFDMSAGGLVNINSGVIQGGYFGTSWGANLGSVNIASGATLDLYAESGQVDALTGSGTVQDNYPTPATVTFTVGVSNGSGVFSGSIVNAAAIIALVKTGTGTETLAGANSYGGGTTITSGTIKLASASTLGSTGGNLAINGGGLDLNGNSLAVGMLSGSSGAAITSSAAGMLTLAVGGTGSSTYAGSITSGAATSLALIKGGGGTLILSGNNSYGGGTTINGGSLEFPGINEMPASGTVTVGSGGTLVAPIGGVGLFTTATSGAGSIGGLLGGVGGQGAPVVWNAGSALGIDTTAASGTYAGVITNPGGNALGLAVLGSNTLTLTASNTYSGSTVIAAGTLQIAGAGSLGASGTYAANIVDNGAFVFNSSANQTLSGIVSGTGATTVSSGALTIQNSPSAPGSVTYASNVTVAAGAVFGLANTNSSFNDRISFNPTISGSGVLNISGSGFITVNSENNTVTVTGGINILSGGLCNDGGATSGFGTTIAPLSISAGALFDLRGGSSQFGALSGAGSVINSYSAATLTVGEANASGTFSGTIQDGGTAADPSFPGGTGGYATGLAKVGAGTQTLSGSNAYSGPTTVSGGTLQIGGAGTLGPSGTYTGAITISSSGAFVYNSSANDNLAGAISGSGSVTVSGLGALTLSGGGTYTGPTNIVGGTLVVSGALSGSQVNVAGGVLAGICNIVENVIVGTGSGAKSSSILAPSAGGGTPAQSQFGVIGNLTLNNDAAYQFSLDSGNIGNSDSLYVSGTLTLAGSPALAGFDIGSTPLTPGTQYAIAYANSVTGTFADLPEDALVQIGSNWFSIDYYNTTYGGAPDDIVLTAMAVPEPGTWAAILVGFGMVVRFRRRREG